MRRVPTLQYAIIGHGRVASHFSYYLSKLNISYCQWSRSSQTSLLAAVKSAHTVLLLINDAAISSFIDSNPCLWDQRCVHFSGTIHTERASVAYPLMTFSAQHHYSFEEYQNIPWLIESPGPSFSELLPGLPNPFFKADRSRRAYCHALCVLSNNFTSLLWKKFMNTMLQEFNVPKEWLMPIFQRTFQNIEANHNTALTGPLMRGDRVTVEKDLEALNQDAFRDVYQAFVEAYQAECLKGIAS